MWIIGSIGLLPGHLFDATRFILSDQGSYLYAIGRWQAGEALYRDFAWQYGPFALGWYRGFAAVGGNTPLTLVLASSVAFALGWGQVARLVVDLAGLKWGGGFAVVFLLPVMALAGPYAFNGPHGAIEMLLLCTCARLVAKDAPAWQLGALTGLLQWVRFGPQVVALAVILLVTVWRRAPAAGGTSIRSRRSHFCHATDRWLPARRSAPGDLVFPGPARGGGVGATVAEPYGGALC